MENKTKRRIWILSDSHFGHAKLIDIGERPMFFETKMLTKLTALIKDEDIVIHLGDFCIGQDELWHREFMKSCGNARRYLVKGNHDHKSDSWYLDHGWDLVVHGLMMKVNGKSVLLTHRPSAMRIGNFNLHGHTHGNIHRDEDCKEFYDPTYHIEVAMEKKPLYEPRLLNTLIK